MIHFHEHTHHHHNHCQHYCSHCNVTYCCTCGEEWGRYYYPYITSPFIGIGDISSNITYTAQSGCSHTH